MVKCSAFYLKRKEHIRNMQPSRHLALGSSAANESILPSSSAMLRTNTAAVRATVNEKGEGGARGNRFRCRRLLSEGVNIIVAI